MLREAGATARLMLVRGKVQQADGVTHLIGEHLEDISADLALLSTIPAGTPIDIVS